MFTVWFLPEFHFLAGDGIEEDGLFHPLEGDEAGRVTCSVVGFQVEDLGVDVAPEVFAKKAKETGAQLVALSALLTTTMPQMKTVVDEITKAGGSAKIMVGGAPLTQAYADEIGANGYAPDAASAVDLAKELVA